MIRGAVRLKRSAERVARRWFPRAVVLMYHRIADLDSDPLMLAVQPRHFAEQLAVLRTCAYPVRLEDLLPVLSRRSVPRNLVAVTFDDGYLDNLTNAKPALEGRDVPATVFVASGQVDATTEFWWDELERLLLTPGTLPRRLSVELAGATYSWDLEEGATYSEDHYRSWRGWTVEHDAFPTTRQRVYFELCRLVRPLPHADRLNILASVRAWAAAGADSRPSHRTLSSAELADLARGGLVEIGAHTVTHPILSTLTPSAQQSEIALGKKQLEAIVGSRVQSFAYPYGEGWAYSPDTVSSVGMAGFERACSTEPSTAWRHTPPLEIPRFVVRDWDGDTFAARLAQWQHA